MRRYVVCLMIWLAGCQVGVAQERVLNPDEVLWKAVSKTRLCPYRVTREVLDDEHYPMEFFSEAEKEEEKKAQKLSLYTMFRPGRYQLENVVREAAYDDRPALTIDFSPQPEEKRLKPFSGEDERYHWAMNRLHGKIYVDAETRGIMRVEAHLPLMAPYEVKGVTVFKLHELTFLMEQKLWGDEWLPRKIEMEIRYTHRRWWFPALFWKEVHERYTLPFNCGPA